MKFSAKHFIPAFFAVAALLCSAMFTYYCESAQIQFGNDAAGAMPIKFGLYSSREIIGFANPNNNNNKNNDNNNGDEANLDDFFEYGDCVPLNENFSEDSYFMTARAFGNLVMILGGLLTLLLTVSPCLPVFANCVWKSLAFLSIVLLPLFQGLTFLLFKSDVCNPKLFGMQLEGICVWSNGSIANVFAIVLWILTGMIMLAMGAP